MQLIATSHTILSQLAQIVDQIDERDFVKPCPLLGGSSIGQHLRHTLEFFICLENGCACGTVNYDKRAHDKLIESDKEIARSAIQKIMHFIGAQREDFALGLEVGYALDSEESMKMNTNYFRELAYNIEHAVHHMAIMKIGIHEVAPYLQLPSDFGIAASTIRYQNVSMTVSR